MQLPKVLVWNNGAPLSSSGIPAPPCRQPPDFPTSMSSKWPQSWALPCTCREKHHGSGIAQPLMWTLLGDAQCFHALLLWIDDLCGTSRHHFILPFESGGGWTDSLAPSERQDIKSDWCTGSGCLCTLTWTYSSLEPSRCSWKSEVVLAHCWSRCCCCMRQRFHSSEATEASNNVIWSLTLSFLLWYILSSASSDSSPMVQQEISHFLTAPHDILMRKILLG